MKVSDFHSNPAGSHPPVSSQPEANRIREELQRILQSHAFRTSRRSQQFLQYVVEHTLQGRSEDMKERTIGVAVFDRPPAYDTGEDATVRVAANEVRKRLAQYRVECPEPDVRIDLPLGSYVPEFHLPVPAATSLPDSHGEGKPAPASGFWRKQFPALAVVLLVAVGAGAMLRWRSATPFEEFWQPLVESPRPVLVCMAHPRVFHVMGRLRDEYRAKGYEDQPSTKGAGKRVSVELEPGDIVQTEQYVGGGDAYAAGLFSSLLARMEKAIHLRIGNDVSFSDLRSSPAVLIGAYSNQWTMQSNAEYRFGFGPHSVVDHSQPGREWKLKSYTPDYRSPEDYLIVSRILQSYSGEPVIMAAGTTNMGTRAAAEFLTNPEALNRALLQLPAGWQSRNLQMVLHCRVIGATPGPPKVIATHVW